MEEESRNEWGQKANPGKSRQIQGDPSEAMENGIWKFLIEVGGTWPEEELTHNGVWID